MKDLETENLILRKFRTKDSEEAYKNWAGVPELAEISDFRLHANVDETRDIIEMELSADEEDEYAWAVELKETKELVGFVRVYEISRENKKCKITWTLGFNWWYKNISNEALDRVIDYLLHDEDFDLVVSQHYSNKQKWKGRVLDTTIMQKEAVLKSRKIDKKTGEKLDFIIYSVLK